MTVRRTYAFARRTRARARRELAFVVAVTSPAFRVALASEVLRQASFDHKKGEVDEFSAQLDPSGADVWNEASGGPFTDQSGEARDLWISIVAPCLSSMHDAAKE
jgi:hypothetical protein